VSRVRAAVIGVGYLGRFHAQKFASMDDVDLAAVMDIDPERAREVAREVGSRACASYDELPDDLDAVSIAVPTTVHAEVAIPFLERGVAVLLEKPISARLDEARAIIEAASKGGAKLQIGHLERFNPAVEAVENIISEPKFIEVQRLGSFSARSLDVDVVLDLMVHDLDIIMALIKDEVSVIRSTGIHVVSDKVDIANARLEFKGGCVATLTASRVHQGKVRKLRIFEPTAYYAIDYIDQEVKIFPLSGRQTDIKSFKIKKEEPLKKEILNFLACIAEGRTGKVSGEEGLQALRLAHDVLKEMETT